MSSNKAFFITGTDTEIGKTTIACSLLFLAQARKLATAAIKPVASGCMQTADGLRNDDALALWKYCSLPLNYAEINPFAFEPAIAPHIAAQESNTELSVAKILPLVKTVIAKNADFTLVEGAGGWRVPLNNKEYLSDLAKGLELPVIMVVGVRLGCVSHALLTKQAIEQDGLTIAGWVANIVDPNVFRLDENLQTLHSHLNLLCLGIVPHLNNPTTEQVASHLDINPLF